MSQFISQTEIKYTAKALSIAKDNRVNVYGSYRLSTCEYVVSGDLNGKGDFWYVDSSAKIFRAATQKEYTAATA
jgi:hypothetical protein